MLDINAILAAAPQPTPLLTPQQIQQQQFSLAQLGQQVEAGQLQAQQQQQAMRDDQNARQLFARAQSTGQRPTDNDVMNALGPQKGPALLKSWQEADETRSKIQKNTADTGEAQARRAALEQDYAGAMAKGVLEAGINDASVDLAIKKAHADGYESEAQILRQAWAANPQGLTPMLQQIVSASPKQQELTRSKQTADAATSQAATAAGGLVQRTANEAAVNAETAKHDAQMAAYQQGELANSRARLSLESQGQNAVLELNPNALDTAADLYNKTGQLPPMGMGKAGAAVRSKIMNRASDLAGGVVDLAGNKASYKSDSTSLVNLQKQRDSIGAFESTAGKNLDNFLTLSKGMVDSGSPLVNTPLRILTDKLVGSENQAAVNAARQVAVNEIAKITSNPNLSGSLSDSARHEVASFIPENATLKQIYAVSKVLRQDMANRPAALDEQIGQIKQRMGSSSSVSAPAPAVAHGIPDLGSTFNGGKVLKVTRIQ